MRFPYGIFAVGMLLTGALGAAAATQQQDLVLHDCDDIKALQVEGITPVKGGSVAFTSMIECEKIAAISFEGDTVVYAPAGIDTTNLLFVTLPDVRVVFSAPTVTLKRNQGLVAQDVGLLWGGGTFEFEVTEELPANAAGSLEDKYSLNAMVVADGVHSTQRITYTETAIIASRPSAAEADAQQTEVKETPAQISLASATTTADQDGHAMPSTTASQSDASKISTSDNARRGFSTTADSNGDASGTPPPSSAGASAESTVSPASTASSDNSVGSGGGIDQVSDTDQPGSRFPTDPSLLRLLESKQAGVFGSSDPTNTAAAGQDPSSNAWTRKSRHGSGSKPWFEGGGGGGGSSSGSRKQWFQGGGGGGGGSSSGSRKQWFQGGGGGDNGQRFGGGRGRSSTTSSSIRDITLPPEILAHPARFLKVGEPLTGMLIFDDNRSAVSVSRVDGSVRLGKAAGEPTRDEKGKVTGPAPLSFTTLLRSDSNKAMEVHQRRAAIRAEDAEKKWWASTRKKSKVSRKERKLRERAKQHLGEVVLTMNNRGVVKVTMDGTTVLEQGGPSRFWYRRKGPYQLRPTRDGFIVSRRGKVTWTETADGDEDYRIP